MTNEEFDSLVFKLEEQARRNPSGYQLRVLLLALLGNAYMAVMILLIGCILLALAASVVVLKALAIKLILIVGVFLWAVLKALWLKIEPPQGTKITKRDSPELFAMIADLRRKLGASSFHQVLVTNEFNAAVVQAPRLGIFGWHENYLLIGLPLVKALSVEQFKAVLAHEFGHLAKGHGRMSNWIYRQRLRWGRLMATLEANESKGSFLFRPFLRWYAPYFNAYSFPLARANEYEADATSVRLTSSRVAAEALTNVNVIGSFLGERYWPQIHKQADELPRPAFAPFSGMGPGVTGELDAESVRRWLNQSLEQKTTSADTHPALADRLQAIGEASHFAPPAAGEAADRLLGSALASITAEFDRQWQEQIEPAWQERHREVQENRRRLAELDSLHGLGSDLPWKDAYERAALTEWPGNDPDKALEQFRALHAREPGNAYACFALGVRLLGRDDDAGMILVERAMQLDEQFILQGSRALYDYCNRRGKAQDAAVWERRMVDRAQLLQAAERERNQIRLNDKFEHHGLPADALAGLVQQLKALKGVRKVYLVRKRTQHFQEKPMYVLGFTVTHFFQLHSRRRVAEAMQQINGNIRFPGETLIVNVEGDNYRFGRKFRWMRGSRIL